MRGLQVALSRELNHDASGECHRLRRQATSVRGSPTRIYLPDPTTFPDRKIQRTNVVRINRELSAFEGVLVWYLD